MKPYDQLTLHQRAELLTEKEKLNTLHAIETIMKYPQLTIMEMWITDKKTGIQRFIPWLVKLTDIIEAQQEAEKFKEILLTYINQNEHRATA